MEETLDLELARRVDAYVEELCVPRDQDLERSLAGARAAGLPAINVSPNEGKLLYLIARMAGARRVLEIGTLAGYSAAWLARAVPDDGRVVTLEVDRRHAEVARENLERAGLGRRVEIRVGPASVSLRRMIADREAAFDLIFIDADKEHYGEYLELSVQLARPGSVILADNVIRGGRVLRPDPGNASDVAVSAFNRAIAAHPRLESLILPIIREKLDGLSISIVR
jgi:predicted O-methyltransferase YrrM